MLFPQLEEKLQASKQALNTATSENVIEQCKQHLALLAEYRIRLYKLSKSNKRLRFHWNYNVQ